MLKLYHKGMSTCSRKARFLPAGKGLDWEGVEPDLRRGDQQPDIPAVDEQGRDGGMAACG